MRTDFFTDCNDCFYQQLYFAHFRHVLFVIAVGVIELDNPATAIEDIFYADKNSKQRRKVLSSTSYNITTARNNQIALNITNLTSGFYAVIIALHGINKLLTFTKQ